MTKTLANVETNRNVNEFIESISNQKRKKDAKILVKLIGEIKKVKPKIWGKSIIAFGKYKYQRKNGEEYEWFNVAFSPARTHTTIYLMYDITKEKNLLDKLGNHRTGKGCLYIKSLDNIDLKVLKKLITKSDRWQ